jgi:molybdenum cofactor synthesis domain-containing protein
VRNSSWILAVGDEVLSGHTLDTNSNWLAEQLRETPFPVARITVVPDDATEISEVVASAVARRIARIFCCGGLGPTPDDRTVPALAATLGLELVEDPATLERIRQRVRRMHQEGRIPSPEPNPGNRKMALIPAGAMVLRNPVGMAPPLAIPLPGGLEQRWLLTLPGVPRELRAIVTEEVIPTFCGGHRAVTYRESHFQGVPESQFFPILTSLA